MGEVRKRRLRRGLAQGQAEVSCNLAGTSQPGEGRKTAGRLVRYGARLGSKKWAKGTPDKAFEFATSSRVQHQRQQSCRRRYLCNLYER